MILTESNLVAIMPNVETPVRWVGPLNVAMQEFDIVTPRRMAQFLAQIAHESGELNRVVENLNYSMVGLRLGFKRYFQPAELRLFAKNPFKIANRVYANRNGNGDEASGDGWRYRGRGLLQLTGRRNYEQCGKALGLDLIGFPDLLLEPANAARSAGWYWHSRGINQYADREDLVAVTRLICGGLNGLEHRKAWYARAKDVLA